MVPTCSHRVEREREDQSSHGYRAKLGDPHFEAWDEEDGDYGMVVEFYDS